LLLLMTFVRRCDMGLSIFWRLQGQCCATGDYDLSTPATMTLLFEQACLVLDAL
jgi:hypothetical protein